MSISKYVKQAFFHTVFLLTFLLIIHYSFAASSESSSSASSQEDADSYQPCRKSSLSSLLRTGENIEIANANTNDRIKRTTASRKKGVTVCITSPGSSVNVHSNQGYGKQKNSHHHHGGGSHHSHSQKNKDDSDESEEDEDESSDEEENDSDETVEESGDENHNHNDVINTGSSSGGKHHNSGGNKPSKGGKKRKDRARVIIEERFSNRNWSSEWIHAKNPNNITKLYNKFSRVYARKSNHSKPNYGIITHNKGGEFYLIATTFPPFNNRNETLVLQFSVQFQTKAHCQLVFLRLYDCQFSTDDFNIQTPYVMQVGPHVCGTSRISRLSAEFQEPGKTTIKAVDKHLEAVNNVSVTVYALTLEPDGTFRVYINSDAVQNGTLRDEFQSYKGYTGICGVGLAVWHSVFDKYFKGQIIIDDILVVNQMAYAEKRRNQILNLYSE